VNRFYRPGLHYPNLWFGIGLFIATCIAVTCLLPARDLPDIALWDKLKHALSWSVLAFCFAGVLQRRHFIWLLLAVTTYGGLIEVAQEAMQLGRHAEWGDLLADFIGSGAGVVLAATPLGRWPDFIESMLKRVFG
jgi:VanZ family protein